MTGAATDHRAGAASDPPLVWSLIRLARPKQWAKSAFVLIGPLYGFADLLAEDPALTPWDIAFPAIVAAFSFSPASSCSYVFNDIPDRLADRPRPARSSCSAAPGRPRDRGRR